jgi:hypothetical protein
MNVPYDHLENAVVGDYSGSRGTSGAPIIKDGIIIGMHQGFAQLSLDNGSPDRKFSQDNNYSHGLLFSKEFHELVQLAKITPVLISADPQGF